MAPASVTRAVSPKPDTSRPVGAAGGRAPTLRGRLARWIALVLGASLVSTSAVRVVVQRRHVLAAERVGAAAFLDRLAATPAAFRELSVARREIDAVNRLVRPWRAGVEIVPRGTSTPPGTALVVTHPLQLPEGAFDLRYRVSDAYVSAAVRQAVLFQLVHAGLTFLLVMAGVDWILRRRLRDPLRALAHQIDHMRGGGGWYPLLPATDAECREIASAVAALGPGLASQVETWIRGEQRAAVATALGRVRRRVVEQERAVADPGPVPARGASPRECARELRAVERLIDSVEEELLRPGDGRPAP